MASLLLRRGSTKWASSGCTLFRSSTIRSPPWASTAASKRSTASSRSPNSSGRSSPVSVTPRLRSRPRASAAAASRASFSSSRAMRCSSLQGPPQGGRQRGDVARLLVATAVDEESGRAAHPATDPAHEVLAHDGRVAVRGQLALDPRHVEPELARVAQQVLVGEGRLMFVEQVVHFPELASRCRRFGDLRGVLRVRMLLGDGKMPEDEAYFAAHLLEQALELGIGAAAELALEVAVLDERDGGVGRAEDVIPRADLPGQQSLMHLVDAPPRTRAICPPPPKSR